MLRTFFAAGFCLALAAALTAGEPSAHAGRASLESLLQAPADLDFGHRQTITVKELLDEIHRKDHISIRFDAPLLASMSGGGHVDSPVNATAACGEGVAKHFSDLSLPSVLFRSVEPNAIESLPAAAAWQHLPQPITSSASTAYCAPPPPPLPGAPLPSSAPNPAVSTTSTPDILHRYLLVVNPADGSQCCSPPIESTADSALVATFDDAWKKLVGRSSAKAASSSECCNDCERCSNTASAAAGNPTIPAKCVSDEPLSTWPVGRAPATPAKCACAESKVAPAASQTCASGGCPAPASTIPAPPHAVVQINVTAPQVIPNGEAGTPSPVKPTEPPHDVTPELLNTEIYIKTIDMHNVSIATALQIALEAVGDGDLGVEASGLPIAVSNAEKLDYVVENDGVLITSRLKALTYKETRVYNVKHLKDLKAEQVAAVIKQSVRPWSWRSRIDDLGEQLRTGGPRIPAKTVTALFKSGVQLASAENPLSELTAAAESTATDAPGDKSAAKPNTPAAAATASDSDSLTAQEAAQLGDALVNGLVTLVHASITTVEIMHYADPPTGTIQTVPGKLIITQSQAAHREIAELLKELSGE